jgi:deoxyribonucleoside regulator
MEGRPPPGVQWRQSRVSDQQGPAIREAADLRGVDQLIEVATQFYLHGRTQVEIARALGLDPSTVSRYLKRARDEGIVHVEIRPPRRRDLELGREIASRFHIPRAVVVPKEADAEVTLASVAAEYVGTYLRSGMRLGVSWGKTVCSVVRQMQAGLVSDLILAQIAGGLDETAPGIQGHELVRHLAELYPNSRVQYLHAPAVVDSEAIRDAIASDRTVQASLTEAARSEVAIVGIGTLDADATLVRGGQLSREDLAQLVRAGAVGSLNTRFFDADGMPAGGLDSRTIAIGWGELRAIPTVIAVAAGAKKAAAIKGALRTGTVDVLITDEATAGLLLERGGTRRR